jgi:TonB family protein
MGVICSGMITEQNRWARWNSFLTGLFINALGVVLLIVVTSRSNVVVLNPPDAAAHYVALVTPLTAPVLPPEPRPVPAPSVEPQIPKPAPALTARLTQPPVQAPKIAEAKTKIEQTKTVEAKLEPSPNLPAPAPKPTPVVKTNVFGSEKSEIATLHRPPREVQTGGFGDPNGIAGQGDPKRNAITVASVGSFDLPAGSGRGNGTAGSHGASGIIRSSGFSDGTASATPHGRSNAVVASSGFNNGVAPAAASEALRIPKKPELQPVEIVYKPRPEYTAQARQLGVEGEVLIEVTFAASGSLHINRVVKGLGYGLDDKALAAAEQIRFRPARRDGQPYDCAALVHIVFELAD